MADRPPDEPAEPDAARNAGRRAAQFARQVEKKAGRRRRHRLEADRGVWQWLGMFGLVGWAVSIPTLGGVALGWWIDKTWNSSISWTLNLLVIGAFLGCWNAWHWIDREGRESDGDDRE